MQLSWMGPARRGRRAVHTCFGRSWRVAEVVGLALVVAAFGSSSAFASSLVLLVDANRDGALTASDTPLKDVASVASGALVLPNVDDDASRCRGVWRRQRSQRVTMDEVSACSDAQTAVIDGAGDQKDLAPIRVAPIPGVSDDATAVISLDPVSIPYGGLHLGTQTGSRIELGATQLRAGATILVEALDIERDPTRWDGRLGVAGTVRDGTAVQSDHVRLHVAPVVFPSGATDALRLFAARPPSTHMIKKSVGAGVAARGSTRQAKRRRRDQIRYELAERRYLQRLRAIVPGRVPLERMDVRDHWVQDQFETGFASVPTPTGVQTMRVTLLAPGGVEFGRVSGRNPAVAELTAKLRTLAGPDRGVVTPPTGDQPSNATWWDVSGALEATPEVPGAPAGKLLLASHGRAAQQGSLLVRDGTPILLGAQAQPVVRLPLDWLAVGHVDEVLSFVKANTRRGWALVLSDPELGLRLLRRTALRNGDATLGGPGEPGHSAQAALTGAVGRATQRAARRMRLIERALRTALSLAEGDIIRIPALFRTAPANPVLQGADKHRGLEGFPANTVNGLHVDGREFFAPDPHGPVIAGVDAFRAATRRAFTQKGVRVQFVDTLPAPHLHGGELHCTTNAERTIDDAHWWRG